MTEENYHYRTNPFFLRNQFETKCLQDMPNIPKPVFSEGELENLLLLGFDRAKANDIAYRERMVHFFLYDYKFERVWKNPDHDLDKLKNYKAVLTPDFSMYLEMAPALQYYNTFRNRWCGAYWASKGLRVVPSVNWGDGRSFEFCFNGIEQGSVVAVSTYMASEHDNRQDQKEWFLAGYNEMLRRIQPEKIICYNTPFPEMEGDIIFVDYELSSWKYMNEKTFSTEDLEAFKIGGQSDYFDDILDSYKGENISCKGGGSAYGGVWRPSKHEDSRLIGEPNSIKRFETRDGTVIDVKYGDDGRAVKERHWTTKPNAKYHTNPHDHIINWENPRYGIPNFGKAINYWDAIVPEFKSYEGVMKMCGVSLKNTPEENRFKTISEFKECIIRGGEPVFTWNGVRYGVFSYDESYCIAEQTGENEKICDTPDEVLAYMVGTDRLRDVITQVTVWSRTI